MPKGEQKPTWDVVETKKPDANEKRPPPPVNDAVRAHAEWFAWAKRQKADFGRAHGAARQAVAASERGLPPAEVEKAARDAIKAGDTTPVDETRQAYSAWFAVAAVDMSMDTAKAHTFAMAGYAAQRDGADVKTATSIAEAAVAPPPPPPPPPPPMAAPPPPPPPPPPPAPPPPAEFTTVPISPSPHFPPPPPVELGDWGPPPGAAPPPPPPSAPPPPPPPPPIPVEEEESLWQPPTPFVPPAAAEPPAPPPATTPPAPPRDTGAWKPPVMPPPAPPAPPEPAEAPKAEEPVAPTTPPTPHKPAATRRGAVDKAVADTKLIAVTRSQAKLVPYGDLKKASNRTLLSDTLPDTVQLWVVAVAGTLTNLAEPAVGHAVAYLAFDQHAGLAYDVHTGAGWPTWFDDLPDQATD